MKLTKVAKVFLIVTLAMTVVFAVIGVANFANPQKAEAQEKSDEYFDQYLDCQRIWSDCLDSGYSAGAKAAKNLMETWDSLMDVQDAIVARYNTVAAVFFVLAGLSAAGSVVVLIVGRKKAQADQVSTISAETDMP